MRNSDFQRFESRVKRYAALLFVVVLVATTAWSEAAARKKKKKKEWDPDRYAAYVWPPPPDEPRIQLEDVISGRSDVEATGKWAKRLLGASPQAVYDRLRKPHAVAFDPEGRVLVTDPGNAALIRFDREGSRMDVLGTQGYSRLQLPLGLDVGSDGIIYVADANLRRVVGLRPDGTFELTFGDGGELVNPTDVVIAPDLETLYVADSKHHRITVYDASSGEYLTSFGSRGSQPGQFNFPTSLAFDPEGNLYVVDQGNSRVQVVDPDGEPMDAFGALGVGFGNFVRPKDIAIDELGLIYVTDNAFNNVQIFDIDFTLLTFVGQGGPGPGRFHGASGVAVDGDRFAVVDQLGGRLQIFRYIVPKDS